MFYTGCVRTALQPFIHMNYTLEDTVPNEHFKYIIDVPNMLEFHEARRWMSATYGYTEDIKKDQPATNPQWAFTVDWRRHKIYLRGDEELSWFKVRHGETQ